MRAYREFLRFRLERWIQRGALHQLLFVAGVISAVAVAGGLVAWLATERFTTPGEAIWWSFLRLTDPGYLGDDEGTVLRVVSTVVTVLGYILFLGSLIAIMTQWLATTLRRLESGLSPISMKDHVVVLGWSNRTAEIVLQLLGARGRLQRFLDERGARKLRVVVLAEHVDAALRQDLRDHVGTLWRESQVFVRMGSALEREDLERLDVRRAAAVVIPSADYELGGAELSDARAVKTLLTLQRMLRAVPAEVRPAVVAEIRDSQKIAIAQSALPHVEIVASDAVLSRLISQSIRHPHLASVFLELLSRPNGNSLYVRRCPELSGKHPVAESQVFPHAKVLGALRPGEDGLVPHLNPPVDFRLAADDLVVFVARGYGDCAPVTESPAIADVPGESVAQCALHPHRVLVLGWSHKVPAMLSEFSASSTERFEVTLVTRVSVADREAALAHAPLDGDRVRVEHVVGDYAVVGFLESIRIERFSSIVFLASAEMQTSEEADARTILGYVLVQTRVATLAERPQILVELLDPTNGRIFAETNDVILVSPRILSHLVTHVCLRPELNSVYAALFVAEGAEFSLRAVPELGPGPTPFAEIERAMRGRGEIALGLLTAPDAGGQRVHLNPPGDREWVLSSTDAVVVLAGET